MSEYTCTDVFVDWLTMVDLSQEMTPWMDNFLRYQEYVGERRAYHREIGRRLSPSNAHIYSSPHDSSTRPIMVLPGEACSWIMNAGRVKSPGELLLLMSANCAHFSRVDLALDYFDSGALAHTIANDIDRHRLSTGRRVSKTVRSNDKWEGCTTYIGSRASPKLLRVYDKCAESKGLIESTRFEFELKDYASQAIWNMVRERGALVNVRTLFSGLLQEFIDDWQYNALTEAYWEDTTIIEPYKRIPMMKVKEWLTRSVVGTFCKGTTEENAELLAWFAAEVAMRQGD